MIASFKGSHSVATPTTHNKILFQRFRMIASSLPVLFLIAIRTIDGLVVPSPPRPIHRDLPFGSSDLSNDSFPADNKQVQDYRPAVSSRRDMLLRSLATTVAGAASTESANAADDDTSGLLLDLPMTRLRLPKNALGEDYVAVQLCFEGGTPPVDVMLDTGLTLEMITPHLQKQLLLTEQSSSFRGLAAGGETQSRVVTLMGASVCDPPSQKRLQLPELHATVQDFPQEHIDPNHDPVEGMLGQEVLSQYDVDLDFPAGRVRLYKPGSAPKNDLVEIPAIVINETGLLGFRLRTGPNQQPVVAVVDCGSPFSAVNWQAAGFLGLPTNRKDPAYLKSPSIVAVGIDGKPMELPTIKVPFTFAGNAQKIESGKLDFETPPSSWKPWKPVAVAVGDLPVFPQLLGDGVRPYQGPAALIGLDVLAQRRVIIESAGSNANTTRQRRIFVRPI